MRRTGTHRSRASSARRGVVAMIALILSMATVPLAAADTATGTAPDDQAEGAVSPQQSRSGAGDAFGGPEAEQGGEIPEVVVPELDDEPLLDGFVTGTDALGFAGDQLDEIARRNAVSVEELEHLLADETVSLDPHGRLLVADPGPSARELADAAGPAAEQGPFPHSQTFQLHSKPGAQRTIYLDFNGHTIANTLWHPYGSLPNPYTATAFNNDANPLTFSNGELDIIQSVWQRVAEDYAPFAVNVTTQDPGYAAINRASVFDFVYGTRVVVTDSPAFCPGGCGGVAYVSAFNATGIEHDRRQPAWCFANSLADWAKYIAECVSHEAGHNVGLSHDGKDASTYYYGHAPWAPIMGAGYQEPVTQWSRGEYSGATNTQDDFAVMATHGLGLMADDHPNTFVTTALIHKGKGIVSSAGDRDLFKFIAPATGTATFAVTPASVSPNLDVSALLWDATGLVVLASSNPTVVKVSGDVANGLNATIAYGVTAGTTYYVQVLGTGHLTATTGYTAYGSIGQFAVSVSGTGMIASCNGRIATIVGTGGADTINGTAGADVIFAGAGNDVVSGNGGNDVICGGPGHDTMSGGTGNDILLGDSGNDRLYGSDGNDSLNGGADNDFLHGGNGNDALNGAAGNDRLWGDAGADTLSGAAGTDVLYGGDGNDTLNGGDGADTLSGEAGNDALAGAAGNDALHGGAGADTLAGGDGADTLNGNADNDQLRGGAGNDALNGGAGSDRLWGDAGADKLNGGTGKDSCNGGAGTDTGAACEVLANIP